MTTCILFFYFLRDQDRGCPKKFARIQGTVHCCFVIKFGFPRMSDKLVINGAIIFLFKSTINWQIDVQ